MLQMAHCSNLILASLPEESRPRWLPHLEEVNLRLGDVLHEAGRKMLYAYFSTSAVVSILSDLENGASAEIAVIGNEGLVGVSIFLGDSKTSHSAVVLSAGQGYRIKASLILEEFNRSSSVRNQLLRFTQALIAQMGQTAVCNRYHSLNQQLCRLLLLILDRQNGNELVMTQELLAHTLGVRREGVTEAALLLQKDGLIRYARGHITVLDRSGIEQRTCECYAAVKNEYHRLFNV
jgi:CRP-like cAMP-binding protein